MPEHDGPQIVVVGAGAIGCYFGARLARAGQAVTLIGRPGHVEAIRRDGLRFLSGGAEERIAIGAATDLAAVRGARLVLFCVKSFDTDAVAQAMAPHLAPAAVVLSLQNGVDNAERIGLHAANPVIPVLVYAAAEMPAPGTVRHTGGGNLVIGLTRAQRSDVQRRRELDEAVELFTAADVPIKVSDDIEGELWTKLVMNCAYNAVCALTNSPYGKMVAMPEVRAVMIAAVEEVVAVARAKGIRLPESISDATIRLAGAMPVTMSSTAQDIAKGRRTEIDHLNGFVVREGEKLGVATPVNRTLHALTRLLEQSARKN
jgi:2-dehydropantoate 2-reductase